jgi:hypothetical protein
MLFSHFHACPARSLDRLESTRDVILWVILSTGGMTAYFSTLTM